MPRDCGWNSFTATSARISCSTAIATRSVSTTSRLPGALPQSPLLGCYSPPVRFDDLSARGVIPVETLAKLPETSPVDVPSVAQLVKATDLITANWDRVVGVDIH